MALLFVMLGCGESKKDVQWDKSKKIAGKEQRLSHISSLVIDGKYAFVSVGGTLADQRDGNSGIRRVELTTGEVTILDDGTTLPQSELGGLAADDKYLYWNTGGSIRRIAKDGGKAEQVVGENVGIGIDLIVDDEKVYWINHGYYVAGQAPVPQPVFFAPKGGGNTEVFADAQLTPHSLVADNTHVYWQTASALMKQLKTGGPAESVYTLEEGAGIDHLAQDANSLYFGLRGKGESRWNLMKIAKTGGEPVTLVKRISAMPFVVDDANVYFFNEGGLTTTALNKVPKDGGEPVSLDSGYASGGLALGGDKIYFASLDDILSIQK